MAKRALSWKRAAAIGWRDLKSAPGKFGFVVLSVAVGVAALVGVRGLSDSFRQTLNTEARSLLAGDLSARMFRAPTAEESDKIAAIVEQKSGIRTTWVTDTISMASVPPDPRPFWFRSRPSIRLSIHFTELPFLRHRCRSARR